MVENRKIQNKKYDNFNFKDSLEKLDHLMKKKLTPIHYKAYRMLYFEKKSEQDVAKYMGYKISPQKNKLGYRQVKNLKKKFLQTAIDLIRQNDIIDNGTI